MVMIVSQNFEFDLKGAFIDLILTQYRMYVWMNWNHNNTYHFFISR